MFNHASSDYICPICLGIQGIENDHTLIRQSDIVYKDEIVTVFIASFFIGNNSGHIIVVPNQHFENIYDLPDELATKIQEVTKKFSIILKNTYQCKGITTLQNNEPDGGQHAFHYHLHIFPRYPDDNLHQNMNSKKLTTPSERLPYAEKIKKELKK